MKQQIRELINQIKSDFPDLTIEGEDSVQNGYIAKLYELLKGIEYLERQAEEMLATIEPPLE